MQQAPPQHSAPGVQQLGAAISRGAAVAKPTTVRTMAASAAREIFVFISRYFFKPWNKCDDRRNCRSRRGDFTRLVAAARAVPPRGGSRARKRGESSKFAGARSPVVASTPPPSAPAAATDNPGNTHQRLCPGPGTGFGGRRTPRPASRNTASSRRENANAKRVRRARQKRRPVKNWWSARPCGESDGFCCRSKRRARGANRATGKASFTCPAGERGGNFETVWRCKLGDSSNSVLPRRA